MNVQSTRSGQPRAQLTQPGGLPYGSSETSPRIPVPRPSPYDPQPEPTAKVLVDSTSVKVLLTSDAAPPAEKDRYRMIGRMCVLADKG